MTKRKQIDFLLDLNQEVREKYRSARANNRQLRRDIDVILDENERLSDELRALQKELQKVQQESAETAKERDELKNRADFLLRANEKLYFQKSQLEERLTVETGEIALKISKPDEKQTFEKAKLEKELREIKKQEVKQ